MKVVLQLISQQTVKLTTTSCTSRLLTSPSILFKTVLTNLTSVEDLLLKTVYGESTQEEYEFLCQFYEGDFDNQQLQLHLETLQAIFPEDMKSATLCVNDLKQFILSLSENECVLIGEIVTFLKLILFLPSTNAVSECSFSAMR